MGTSLPLNQSIKIKLLNNIPSLNALRAFEAVARHMSFTRAAEELCVTQGSVSRHVQNLENELMAKLFNRIPKKLALTDEGESLYQTVHDAFLQISNAVKRLENTHPVFKIMVPPTFATRWLIPRMHRFQQKEPGLEVQITTSMKEVAFHHYNDFDAAVTLRNTVKHADLISEHLIDDALFPVCKPSLITSANPILKPENLENHRLLHSVSDNSEWQSWFEMVGIKKTLNIREQHFELEDSSIQAAISGFGVSLANIHFIQDELALNNLIIPFSQIPPLKLFSYQLTFHRSKINYLPLDKFRKWLLMETSKPLSIKTP
jgi:LysR family glycine cleavage system transcriptional activator